MEEIRDDSDMCTSHVDGKDFFQNPLIELGCSYKLFREGRQELDMKDWIGLDENNYARLVGTIKARTAYCPAAKSLKDTLAGGIIQWCEGYQKWFFIEPKFLDMLVKEVTIVLAPQIEIEDQLTQMNQGLCLLLRERIAQKIKTFWLEAYCFRNSAFLYQYKSLKQMMNINYEMNMGQQFRQIAKGLEKINNVEKKGLDLDSFKDKFIEMGIEEDDALKFLDKKFYKQVMLLAALRIVLWVDLYEDKGIRFFYNTITEMEHVIATYCNRKFGRGNWEEEMIKQKDYQKNKTSLTRNEKNKIYSKLIKEFDCEMFWCPFRTGDVLENANLVCEEILVERYTGRVSNIHYFTDQNLYLMTLFEYENSWTSILDFKMIYQKRMIQANYNQDDYNKIWKVTKKMFTGERDGLIKRKIVEDVMYSNFRDAFNLHLNDKVRYCQCPSHSCDGKDLKQDWENKKFSFWVNAFLGKTLKELAGQKVEKGLYYQYYINMWEVNGSGPYLTKRGIYTLFEARPPIVEFFEEKFGKANHFRVN